MMKMKTFGKLAAATLLLALPFGAKAQDSTALKFFGKPKAVACVYDNALTRAMGLGAEGSMSWRGISAGGSLTLAQTNKKAVVEESGLWVSSTFAGVGLCGYVYTDLFYKVAFSEPAVGINATHENVKVGVERSVSHSKSAGFSDIYVKYALGNVTPGIVALEWGGQVQAFGASISTTSNLGSASISTQTQYNWLVESNGGSIQFRLAISPN